MVHRRLAICLISGMGALASGQTHPVIEEHCLKCHGGVKQKGGLDLRTLDSAVEGGETDTALIPGDPEKSPLFQLVQIGSDPHMPPKKQLEPEEIQALREWIATVKIEPEKPLILPDAQLEASQVIDQLITQSWEQNRITPASRASNESFLRRVYLDLIGRIPTQQEFQSFLSNPDRHDLIDQLTERKGHALHLAEIFNVVFLDRAESRKRNRGERKEWIDYLRWVFETNRPWDQVGRDLIIARPQSAEEKGASHFLYEQRDSHHEMAVRTSRALMGKQVQCAQCHDHPIAPEIEQGHYWGLVAFFNRSLNVKTPEGPQVAERGAGGYDEYANLEGKTSPAQLILYHNEPVTEPTGKQDQETQELYHIAPPEQWFRKLKKDEKLQKDLPSLPTPKFSRREALATVLTTDNPDFSRALVNRIWALLMGRGIVHPVDLMDSAHPPSHPELLAWLARDFSAHGHDVRRLIRQITRSQAYQLDSRPADQTANPPLDHLFARSLDKPLSAEVLARSIRTSLGHDPSRDQELRSRFTKLFPDLFEENYSPTVQQTMFLTNDRFFDQLIADSPLLKELLQIESPDDLVTIIFQRILTRLPDEVEKSRAMNYVRPNEESSIRQLVWALITGAEFRINH